MTSSSPSLGNEWDPQPPRQECAQVKGRSMLCKAPGPNESALGLNILLFMKAHQNTVTEEFWGPSDK